MGASRSGSRGGSAGAVWPGARAPPPGRARCARLAVCALAAGTLLVAALASVPADGSGPFRLPGSSCRSPRSRTSCCRCSRCSPSSRCAASPERPSRATRPDRHPGPVRCHRPGAPGRPAHRAVSRAIHPCRPAASGPDAGDERADADDRPSTRRHQREDAVGDPRLARRRGLAALRLHDRRHAHRANARASLRGDGAGRRRPRRRQPARGRLGGRLGASRRGRRIRGRGGHPAANASGPALAVDGVGGRADDARARAPVRPRRAAVGERSLRRSAVALLPGAARGPDELRPARPDRLAAGAARPVARRARDLLGGHHGQRQAGPHRASK